MTFEEICLALGARGYGNKRMCRCPAHDDRRASLSLSLGDDGRTLIHCHAGCGTEAVLAAAGLKLSDLYSEPADTIGDERWRAYVEGAVSRRAGRKVRIEAVYDYLDIKTGAYAYTKLRLTGKEMAYGVIRDGRFSWGLEGIAKGVFTRSLDALKRAAERGERVYYVEGEKDALTLQRRGYTAVTAGGCGDWNSDLAPLFTGAEVVICADNDPPGMKLARSVERDLRGVAKSVAVIVPTPKLPKGDITDFFENGGTDAELERLIVQSVNAPPGQAEAECAERPELDRFHLRGAAGQITGVFDWEIREFLKKREHIMVLGSVPYIYENGVYTPDVTGSRLTTMIEQLIYTPFVRNGTLKRVYDLFLSDDSLQVRYEDLNAYPMEWICFRNGMYDPVTGQLLPHDPRYRAVNQLPHDFDLAAAHSGEMFDEWLAQTFPAEDDREMLLQYIGLCMNRDTRQQKFLLLNGLGGTGKSGLISLVVDIVGERNCSHVPLEKLGERFTAIELLGKLLNSCADLRITALEDVSVLKQLLGEDSLRGEAKGRDGVSFRSYAKLLFSVNELPTIKGERTNGFYRRLLVLTMNRVPRKTDVDLFGRLRLETDHIIHMAAEALGRMYAAGAIAESQSSRAAVRQMKNDSDSVSAWISDRMHLMPGERMDRAELYTLYRDYCSENERQELKRNGFYKALRSKGLIEVKERGVLKFIGIGEGSLL